MRSQSSFPAKRVWSTYKTLLLNRKARFVFMLLSLAAVCSLMMTLLTFAQKREKEKVLSAESNAQRASEVERPRRTAPDRKDAKNRKRLRNGDQDQDLTAQSQERGEKERGERKPRMFQMKRGRQFNGDLRQLPQGGIAVMERPELEGPEPSPGFYVPPGQSSPTDEGGKPQQSSAVASATASAPAPPPSSSF